MNPILECRGLTKNYGSFTALSNLNLSLDRGQIIGLLGPNGSGKTTLIKLINGLLVPTDGRILIDGAEPSVTTRNIVSYLPERTYLSDWMKVKEIVSYFKDFYENFDEKRAYEMLAHLQIDPNARLRTFSKGTKEKVQLILVMSRNADLYVLDEPIGGVDPAARDYILNTILTNYNENATILISTHLITDIENILDRVLFLQNGHIALNASVDDIRIEHGKSVDTLDTMDLPNVILIVSFVFLISIWIVVPCATSILIVVRYYKSLYTDEGYLTLTLPATRGQLLFSKAFAACVWSILDLAIVIAGLAIVVIIPQVYQNSAEALNELEKALEMSPSLFFWSTVGISVVGCFGNVALYYFSVSIGQLLSSHRVLGAVIAYFAISTVFSVLMLIIMFAVGYDPFLGVSSDSLATTAFLSSYKASAIICILETFLFFGGTYYLLKKKTNLN